MAYKSDDLLEAIQVAMGWTDRPVGIVATIDPQVIDVLIARASLPSERVIYATIYAKAGIVAYLRARGIPIKAGKAMTLTARKGEPVTLDLTVYSGPMADDLALLEALWLAMPASRDSLED